VLTHNEAFWQHDCSADAYCVACDAVCVSSDTIFLSTPVHPVPLILYPVGTLTALHVPEGQEGEPV
jgi:hypothetical protein